MSCSYIAQALSRVLCALLFDYKSATRLSSKITISRTSITMLRSIISRVPVASVVDVDDDTIVRTPHFLHVVSRMLTLTVSYLISHSILKRCERFFRSRLECHNYHGGLLPKRVRVHWGQYTGLYAPNSKGTLNSTPNSTSRLRCVI